MMTVPEAWEKKKTPNLASDDKSFLQMYKPYHNLGWSNFIPCIDGKVIGVLLIEK
jgi:hypothetical protein